MTIAMYIMSVIYHLSQLLHLVIVLSPVLASGGSLLSFIDVLSGEILGHWVM